MTKPINPGQKAAKTGKHPGGRPTKFTAKMKQSLEKAYKLGLTDCEVAEIVGIDQSLIYKWKKRSPKFFQSVKDWKDEADHEIEHSLRERAHGYEHPETKAQWVQDEQGGRWETLDMVKHYPPDPTSMIFWLKNRQPEKWRDKTDVEHTGGVNINIVKFSED